MEIFGFQFDNLSSKLLIIFLGFLFIQLVYYVLFFLRAAFFKGYAKNTDVFPVSIVICARDEADNLEKNLPAILEQNYPDYEVIVVNDCSIDETEDLLKRFQLKYKHLKTTQIKEDEKFSHGKKLALTIGIKAASNDWILFTDADCSVDADWLSKMQQNFTEDTEIVLGYGGFRPQKGLLNSLIRFDSLFIALQYFGMAICKIPYMGVGRNLAYRKSTYFRNKGFASHMHLLSGDDDLFVNQVANNKNTRVQFRQGSHTISEAKSTFKDWSRQKRRHLTTGAFYKLKFKIILAIEPFSRTFFYWLFILLLVLNPEAYLYIILPYMLRLLIQIITFKKAIRVLNERKLLLPSLLYDIVLPYIYIYFYLTNRFSTTHYRWR